MFPPLTLPTGQLEALRAQYAQPPRDYHHYGHALAVLEHCAAVSAGHGWQQPAEVQLAALYHDAVYVPGRSDNEARSAQLAASEIARWLPDAGIDVDTVSALINLTARHASLTAADVDGQQALFLDCDMAILGAPWEVFSAYHQGIADEYRGVVPRWLFGFKRRRFLAGLLASERIFLSVWGHAQWDAAARDNLARILGRKPPAAH
jgi:predicted metal-dependent HD superfamily phosphohydrolase